MLNLIERLPRNSHYIEAVSDDDEVARAMAGLPERPPQRRLREWSVEVELLVAIAERLGVNIQSVLAAGGVKKPPRFDALPRPKTAMDRQRSAARHERHRSIVARVLPDQQGHP